MQQDNHPSEDELDDIAINDQIEADSHPENEIDETPLVILKNGSIRLWDMGRYNYEIPISRIPDQEALLGWVHHLCEKNWVTTDHIAGLLELACAHQHFNLYRNA